MKGIAIIVGLLSAAGLGFAGPAFGQFGNAVTYIASTGNDANNCLSAAAPCRSLNSAIEKVAVGGEIRCVDSVIIPGAATVSKPITIDCSNTDEIIFSVLDSSGLTISISEATYPNAVVKLRGLTFAGDADPVSQRGLNAIQVFGGGAVVHIEDCDLRGFTRNGIYFTPSSNVNLVVSNTSILDNPGGGIYLAPVNPATSRVMLDRVLVSNNGPYGIQARDGALVSAIDSRVTQNAIGFFAASFNRGVDILVDRAAVADNTRGLVGAGANGSVRVSNSLITGSSLGLDGNVFSLGGNSFTLNGTDGTFKATIAKR